MNGASIERTLLSKTALVGSLAAVSLLSTSPAFSQEIVTEDTTLSGIVDTLYGDVGVGSPNGVTLTIDDGSDIFVDGGVAIGFKEGFEDGVPAGDKGSVIVKGQDTNVAVSQEIMLGFGGEGTLSVLDGAAVAAEETLLGKFPGGSGTLIVDGVNSSLLSGVTFLGEGAGTFGELQVANGGTFLSAMVAVGGQGDQGAGGSGEVAISNNGYAVSIATVIGEGTGATGNVTVSGLGSSWDFVTKYMASVISGIPEEEIDNPLLEQEGTVVLGQFAGSTGNLNITEGGRVSSFDGFIGGNKSEYYEGDETGGTGNVFVSGDGSTWSNFGRLTVGSTGTGSLKINDGGSVTTSDMIIGDEPSGNGSVSVSGAGSKLDVSERLAVGGGGEGTLTISDGAVVSVQDGMGTVELGAKGTINIGAAKVMKPQRLATFLQAISTSPKLVGFWCLTTPVTTTHLMQA